jgi:outer membrane protein
MSKRTILVAFISVALTVGIYNLPKAVVSSNQQDSAQAQYNDQETEASSEAFSFNHQQGLSAREQNLINNLRESFYNSDDKEKSAIFADSLAGLFQKYFMYDSAAKYLEKMVVKNPGQEAWVKAGDNYYEALGYSMDENKSSALAQKVRTYYEKALEQNPQLFEVKAKLAMTYISTANPMQGVTMLREVLEQDPGNEMAHFNMGLLSMQSNQLSKAVERFENLLKINENHLKGRFYLALAYYQMGDKQNAKKHFNIVKQKDTDPAVLATVEEYLSEIK